MMPLYWTVLFNYWTSHNWQKCFLLRGQKVMMRSQRPRKKHCCLTPKMWHHSQSRSNFRKETRTSDHLPIVNQYPQAVFSQETRVHILPSIWTLGFSQLGWGRQWRRAYGAGREMGSWLVCACMCGRGGWGDICISFHWLPQLLNQSIWLQRVGSTQAAAFTGIHQGFP